MQELYPQAWELFLVRDVRAMIAYKTRKGFGDFGREKAGGDAVWLADLRAASGKLSPNRSC